jgi:hypothetical protein
LAISTLGPTWRVFRGKIQVVLLQVVLRVEIVQWVF